MSWATGSVLAVLSCAKAKAQKDKADAAGRDFKTNQCVFAIQSR